MFEDFTIIIFSALEFSAAKIPDIESSKTKVCPVLILMESLFGLSLLFLVISTFSFFKLAATVSYLHSSDRMGAIAVYTLLCTVFPYQIPLFNSSFLS